MKDENIAPPWPMWMQMASLMATRSSEKLCRKVSFSTPCDVVHLRHESLSPTASESASVCQSHEGPKHRGWKFVVSKVNSMNSRNVCLNLICLFFPVKWLNRNHERIEL